MSHDHPHGDHEHDHGDHHLHVTPFWPMLIVFLLLLFFTWLTVVTSRIHHIDIGNTHIEIGATLHIVVALGIASIKSALVLGFFMHLLYDKALNTIILASTLFAISLFLGLTLMDIAVRDDIDPQEAELRALGGEDYIIPKAIERKKASKAEGAYDEGKDGDEKAKDDEQGEDGAH